MSKKVLVRIENREGIPTSQAHIQGPYGFGRFCGGEVVIRLVDCNPPPGKYVWCRVIGLGRKGELLAERVYSD